MGGKGLIDRRGNRARFPGLGFRVSEIGGAITAKYAKHAKGGGEPQMNAHERR